MKNLRAPFLLFVVPALLVGFAPERTDGLLFDRAALAHGELWRLWTGHWMHFSTSHLLWNLVALLAAGTWLERCRPGVLWRHTLLAAPLISLTLLIAEPRMQVYGGLSALATSIVTLLALAQLQARRADRALWTGLLVAVGLKILYDTGHASPLFARFDSAVVRPSVFAHAAGAAIALLLYPLWRRWPKQTAPAVSPNDTAGTRDEFPAAKFR